MTDAPDTCRACGHPLWLEGALDNIALCHACYSNDTLREYGYTEESHRD